MNIRQQITSATSSIPKPINPTVHAILDYSTAAYFFGVAAGLWGRNRAGAIGALVNGSAVLGLSLITDYPGGVWKRISFPTHAKVDGVQAAMAAAVPVTGRFADEASSWFFFGQAANEASVIAMTDWGAVQRERKRLRRAA
jgi:hypothetical protein